MEFSIEEKNKIIDVWISKVSFYGYLIAFDFMEADFYLRVRHFIMRVSFSRWNDFINFNPIEEDFYYLNNVFEDYFREREKLIEYMADNRIFFIISIA